MATERQIKAEKQRINSRIRHKRERETREIGTHTKEEWNEMVEFFESTCAICFNK